MSSKDTDEEHEMHSKSDNIAIKVDNEADEVINNLFESRLSRYEIGLDILIKDSDFVFDYFASLLYKNYKMNPNCSELYTNSFDWKK